MQLKELMWTDVCCQPACSAGALARAARILAFVCFTAVAAQLAAKGLTEVQGEADCYVYTHVKSTAQQSVSIDHFGYGGYNGWGGWGGSYGTTSVNVSNYIEGTLIVDIVDGGTKQLAWRGLGTKTFYPDSKPEKVEKGINKVTSDMFMKFPPKPKK